MRDMRSIILSNARAGLSCLVDDVIRAEVVTITRHGRPVSPLVSVEAAKIARNSPTRKRAGLVRHLRTFPAGEFPLNCEPFRYVVL